MNEITLLREYGPDAEPAAATTLTTARNELMAVVTASTTDRGRRLRTGPGRRSVATRAAVLVAAAACVTGIAIASQPSRHANTGTVPAITLVAYQTPVFPLSLTPVPAGLSTPTFSGSPGNLLAVYPSVGAADDVYVYVSGRDLTADYTQASGVDLRFTTVDGHPAKLYTVPADGNAKNLNLSWERQAGQWVGVAGNGRFATEDAVRSLAAALVDQPQQIPLKIHLAPSGWVLRSFKDDTILTLGQPDADDSAATLSVQLVDALDTDFAHAIGAASTDTVSVNGQPGELAQAQGEWILQADLGSGGAAFRLQAPIQLTRQQVLLIADSVTAS